MTAGFVAFVLLLSLLVPLVLYVLISDETSNSEVVDRKTAEREAMSLGGRDARARSRDAESTVADSREPEQERADPDQVERDHGGWGYSRLEDE